MTKQQVVLVFGESDNDRSALVELVHAIRPDVHKLDFRKLRQPPVYLRSRERPATRRKSASEIARLVLAANVAAEVKFVVTHQDCDAIEPAHVVSAATMKAELDSVEVNVVVVFATPAFEMETWWMLFPKEIRKVQPLWRLLDYGTQNVGLFRDAKEKLVRDLRPTHPKKRSQCRDYEESDGVKIAAKIRETGAAQRDTESVSNSFSSFKNLVLSLRL